MNASKTNTISTCEQNLDECSFVNPYAVMMAEGQPQEFKPSKPLKTAAEIKAEDERKYGGKKW